MILVGRSGTKDNKFGNEENDTKKIFPISLQTLYDNDIPKCFPTGKFHEDSTEISCGDSMERSHGEKKDPLSFQELVHKKAEPKFQDPGSSQIPPQRFCLHLKMRRSQGGKKVLRVCQKFLFFFGGARRGSVGQKLSQKPPGIAPASRERLGWQKSLGCCALHIKPTWKAGSGFVGFFFSQEGNSRRETESLELTSFPIRMNLSVLIPAWHKFHGTSASQPSRRIQSDPITQLRSMMGFNGI